MGRVLERGGLDIVLDCVVERGLLDIVFGRVEKVLFGYRFGQRRAASLF